MINIAVIDDQVLMRDGIIKLLELNEQHNVAWAADNGKEALVHMEEKDVDLDIIISDIRMPIMDGIEFTEKVRGTGNTTPILILTTFDEHKLFIKAIKAGANGFLLKDVSLEKLNQAIHTVSEGGFLAEPGIISLSSQNDNDEVVAKKMPNQSDLSPKEIQILRYLAAGFSNKEISSAISLAEGTVKNSISTLLKKLDCRDRTQAVLRAMHCDII